MFQQQNQLVFIFAISALSVTYTFSSPIPSTPQPSCEDSYTDFDYCEHFNEADCNDHEIQNSSDIFVCADGDRNRNKPTSLTFKYIGGTSQDTTNWQDGKASVSGSSSGDATIASETVTLSVSIGEEFTIPVDRADVDITINSTTGTQLLTIHASCSAFLYIGDRYGGLILVGHNDKLYTPCVGMCSCRPTETTQTTVTQTTVTGTTVTIPACDETAASSSPPLTKSAKSCATLGSNWKIVGNKCAESHINGICHGDKSFYDARSICESAGARLCTQTELENKLAWGTGCQFDHGRVWTSTTCTNPSGAAGYMVIKGRSTSGANIPDTCVTDLTHNSCGGRPVINVRCCADGVNSFFHFLNNFNWP
eukprot:m.345766 g.345766  ORF g.345766 m.345766 type:complete len:366 (-) comp27204_c0_seq1:31-1128(-)